MSMLNFHALGMQISTYFILKEIKRNKQFLHAQKILAYLVLLNYENYLLHLLHLVDFNE